MLRSVCNIIMASISCVMASCTDGMSCLSWCDSQCLRAFRISHHLSSATTPGRTLRQECLALSHHHLMPLILLTLPKCSLCCCIL